PCARLRRGLASSRLRPAQRKRVRGFSRCPVGASFACEAVGFGGEAVGFGGEAVGFDGEAVGNFGGFGGFGGLGFGADGGALGGADGALGGADGVAGGGFGLNLAVTEGKTPDFHFSPSRRPLPLAP